MIDPSIALGVRPPQIAPVEIETPLERYGKILSLRGLMQRGELTDLQLQQERQQMADEQGIRGLFTGGQRPTLGQLGAYGLRGLQVQKELNAFDEQKLKTDAATVDLHLKEVRESAGIAQGMVDDATKTAGLNRLLGLKRITPEEYQRWANVPFKDPAFQNELTSRIRQAGDADKILTATQEEIQKRLDNAPKLRVEAASRLAPAFERGPEAYAAALKNETPENQQLFGDATSSKQILERAVSPEQRITELGQQETRAATAEQQAATRASQLNANEATLRQDYLQTSKPFQAVTDAYGRIKQAAKGPASGASDIALLYGYMKILDPNSAVREGEFATAQNAGGIPDKIRALWNGLLNGDRLSANVRTEMVQQTENLYAQALADHNKVAKQYADTAIRQNLNPKNVVFDFETTLKPETPSQTGSYKTGDVRTWNGKDWRFIGTGQGDDWKDPNNWAEIKPLK